MNQLFDTISHYNIFLPKNQIVYLYGRISNDLFEELCKIGFNLKLIFHDISLMKNDLCSKESYGILYCADQLDDCKYLIDQGICKYIEHEPIVLNGIVDYFDNYGNHVVNLNKKCKITINGHNNDIIIKKQNECDIDLKVDSNCIVECFENRSLCANILMSDFCKLHIGYNNFIYYANFDIFPHSTIFI